MPAEFRQTPEGLLDMATAVQSIRELLYEDINSGSAEGTGDLQIAYRELEGVFIQLKRAAGARYGAQYIKAWEAANERP